ncbi:uncharacterized protein LOC105427377 [Pogonomyrmex barbatus]|uniref:Uncharacterized protein LOC105427377 n=1 Tax=Pogonomyrmex barbatus TaxID=144034 RepID=A0A6I9W5U3_9HYME|nr:uncharacterized protein LOC105427377 [Pogonomyrmex barbatus]
MGKLPIIPGSDTIPDNARTDSQKEQQTTTTTTTTRTTTTAAAAAATAVIVDDAEARSSAVADRDRRFLIASTCEHVATRGEESAAEIGAVRRRRRDAGIAGEIARRPRRNTWHVEGEVEGETEAVRVTDHDPSGSSRTDRVIDEQNAARNCALSATAANVGLWNVRIVGDDDRRTCCVSADAAALPARRRRIRERATCGGLHAAGRVSFVVRWSRRVGGIVLPARSRSSDAGSGETLLRSTDSITTEQKVERGRLFEVPPVDITDFSKCNERISFSRARNDGSSHGDDDSPTAVREIGGSIDGDVDAENTRTSGDPARLIEIDIQAPCEERLCVLAEETIHQTSTSSTSRFPAKIDPGGRAWRRIKTDTRWKLPRVRLAQRVLLLGLLATSLLCDAVLAAPSSSSVFEDGVGEEDLPRNNLGDDELEIIRRSIVQGLGLQRIPDASKANVSQAEYERAHREYLKQVQLSHDGQKLRTRRDLHVFQAAEHSGNGSSFSIGRRGGYQRHSLYFPVAVSGDAEDVTVDHASLRFLLQGDHQCPRELEALIYLRTPVSRRLLLRRGIPQGEPTGTRWLELDSTEAAVNWLERGLENHGLELEFLHDGQPARRVVSHATLNVFTTSEPGGRRKRSTPEELMPLHKGRRTKCKGENNKKCCRHELTVMFKDLKGFEFIVYPKGFDAGYCKGRCPPRYNPAHHHALLQSLLWKEDRKRVPKPCCAPSKLDQLMIVYFDENDTTQLKVSYWKNIQVLECACS